MWLFLISNNEIKSDHRDQVSRDGKNTNAISSIQIRVMRPYIRIIRFVQFNYMQLKPMEIGYAGEQ